MGSDDVTPPRVFVLQEGDLRSRYDVDVDTVESTDRAEAPRCPGCGAFVGMLTWRSPYRVTLEMHGEELGDFLMESPYHLLLSERLAEAWRAEDLTGLEGFHPVEVVRVRPMKKGTRRPDTIPHYVVVSTAYGRAAVDLVLNRARIARPITCQECRSTNIQAVHGIVLEPGTWSGEDIFRPRGMPGTLLVTGRVKDFAERHGFTNMRFTPAEEYVRDPSHLGPAPLPSG